MVNNEILYKTPVNEFILSKIIVNSKIPKKIDDKTSIKIVICIKGNVYFTNSNEKLELSKGESAVIPAYENNIKIYGNGIIFKATI